MASSQINSKLTKTFCSLLSTKLQQNPELTKDLVAINSQNPRFFSSDTKENEKCPKIEKKSKCTKMFIKGCDPPNPNISCEPTYPITECKKQMAPYPSYSELCAKDPVHKPSECRMCPWSASANPNYKKPKRR